MNKKTTIRQGFLTFYAIVILLFTLSACSDTGNGQVPLRQGTASNDILTFEPVPQDKMMIIVRTGDGMNSALIEQVIEDQFPDVDIVIKYNTPEKYDLRYNDYGDIYFGTLKQTLEQQVEESLIDLSGELYISNFYISSLNDIAINSKIYYLPGPSTITGIVYDKELFDENGWEVPTSQSEFVELCKTIEETGIRAFLPSLYYNDGIRTLLTGFAYHLVYEGVKNYAWIEGFNNGTTTMLGHMEPAFEMLKRLNEEGVWRTTDFDVRPVDRTYALYRDHTCAMTIETQYAPSYAIRYGAGNEHELGMMPFFSGDGPDSDCLIFQPNFYTGISKLLEAPGNEQKLAKTKEILSYIFSPEGQTKLIPPNMLMVPSVKGTQLTESAFLSTAMPTIEKGNLVQRPLFGDQTNSVVDTSLNARFRAYTKGELTMTEALSEVDRIRDDFLAGSITNHVPRQIGFARSEFSIMEFSEYIADAFKRKTGAEIGLCNANTRNRGNIMKLYQGPIERYPDNFKSEFFPQVNRGFSEGARDEHGDVLMLVEMRGENIRRQLNSVYATTSNYHSTYTVTSGLKVEFAPWAKDGERLVSVTMADGSALVDDHLYRVAIWNGSVPPELIDNVVAYYDDSFCDILEAAILEDKELSPFNDGRFTLNWNIVDGE